MATKVQTLHTDKKKQYNTNKKDDDEDGQPEEPTLSDAMLEGELEDGISEEAMSDLSEAAEDDIVASGSSSVGASTITMSTKDWEKLIESSQDKMGKRLLAEHEKSWDKKIKKMERGQAKALDRNIDAMKKDFEAGIDKRIDKKTDQTEKKMKELTSETPGMIDEAKQLVEKAGKHCTGMTMEGSEMTYNSEGWTPRTLEVKGFSSFTDRFRRGVSSEYATEFSDKLQAKLKEDCALCVDWERSTSGKRYTFCFKIVLVLRDVVDREKVYMVKHDIGEALKDEAMLVHAQQYMLFCRIGQSLSARNV